MLLCRVSEGRRVLRAFGLEVEGSVLRLGELRLRVLQCRAEGHVVRFGVEGFRICLG